ncbi:hypothetical protein [Aquimarina sp. Aq107]|uniref:hypothetical protein n=1 Tax=Aquimarina sp. Aq107 TaxID=1191912 RepID=UPI000D55A439|nr:hypothetical protein [Aquimarina sp. Aq107]
MKTKLFYVTGLVLVLFTSCSTNDDGAELSLNDKEQMVKNLFNSFSKSIKNTPDIYKIIETKSSIGLSSEEINHLEQQFLSKQTTEFVNLYNSVVSLNLSNEEIIRIILNYESLIEIIKANKEGDSCAEIIAASEGGSTFFALIAALVCKDSDTSDN